MKTMRIEVPAPCDYEENLAKENDNCVIINAYAGGRKENKKGREENRE